MKYKIKIFFLLDDEIERKNNFNKIKKIKKWWSKLKYKIKIIFLLNDEIERKNNLKKLKNKDHIGKNNIP